MIRLIAQLIANGNAYVAEGHVLFAVSTMRDYGRLSKRSLDEMEAGARVEVAPYKRDPMDFVLWKPSPPELPGWDSPWGRGRPGWHIECSAMSAALLGKTFDIHGGGIDLVFPHHENEIAQSRCAFHTPVMANFWMHNGFLQVEGEKMSKSLGNFFTIHDLLKDWFGNVLRFQMLSTHYRQPIDWTTKRSKEIEIELSDWARTLSDSATQYAIKLDRMDNAKSQTQVAPSDEIVEALSDDLNTPNAITVLRASYKNARNGTIEQLIQFMKDCEFMGLLHHDRLGLYSHGAMSLGFAAEYRPEDERALRVAVANNLSEQKRERLEKLASVGVAAEIQSNGLITYVGNVGNIEQRVQSLIAARTAARKAKNFKESDRIRDELAKMGVVLKDTKDGTTWEITR